jgi:hypothetical protein
MKTSTRLLAAGAALLVAACASSPGASRPDNMARATLMIYSGRPNPDFVLTPEELARVTELFGAARANPAFKEATVLAPILGYQGILLENGARVAGLPATMLVRGEDVEARDGQARFLKDPGATLEHYLLDQAVAHKTVTREELDAVRSH